MAQNDFERIFFFEHARKTCESAYAADPLDAHNLTRWGGALMNLALFQSVDDCVPMLQDAISKFEEALSLNPRKSHALWCLGNAQTSVGFFNRDVVQAQPYFDKARENFRRAVDEEPENEEYLQLLSLSDKMASYQSQVKEKEKRIVNAIWTSDQENIYIDILVEKVKRGEMTTSTFSKQTWKDIEKEFSNQSGIAYDLIHLKNKFNKLRQGYKNFKSLINHIGGGYDPNAHNVTADDETWEEYIKINPDAKHFRTKGCPEYSKLCVIYGDTTATGSRAWSINQDMNIHQTSFPIEENNDSSDDVNETQQRSTSITRTCKRRRSLTGAETIADAILAYGKAKHAKTEFSSVPIDDPCMVKCMMILNEMAETDSIPVEKVVKAAVQFKEPSTRQMFRLMNPTTRKFWVESLE